MPKKSRLMTNSTMKIAITGGAASGKSTVLSRFKSLGAAALDSDALVRDLRADPDWLAQVRAIFGKEAFDSDGKFDAQALGRIVFDNPEARRSLNAITHPIVLRRIRSLADDRTVVEVPLLVETSLQGEFDQIVATEAGAAAQRKRLEARGVANEVAEGILRSQLSDDERRNFADWVIDTGKTVENTYGQVDKIWALLS
ncbi:MAG: dephospho-CoA kinase [Armatimonadetes bacterium]|nr:dephospho-CoA kinase [Armatimonadota bacterium]